MGETTQSPEQQLSQIDLFSGLSSRQLKKVVARAKEVDHEAGREVASEGLGALAFHLILSGAASVSAGGTVLRQLRPGEYFGEISLIDGRPRRRPSRSPRRPGLWQSRTRSSPSSSTKSPRSPGAC